MVSIFKMICQYCGNEFESYLSEIKNGRGKFCNKKCYSKSMGTKVKRICKQCGENFKVNPSNIKRGGGKFCSSGCSNNFRKTRIKKICQQCGEKFETIPSLIKIGKGKFCSDKCFNNSMKNKVKKICQQCKTKFEIWPCEIKKGNGKFCSNKCKYIGNSGENNYLWKGGSKIYPIIWTKELRKRIRDRDNNRCMRCGRAREEFKHALSVHHIDADKNNCDKTNLISLCDHIKGSCHGLTRGKEEYFTEGFRNLLKRNYGYKYKKEVKQKW